MTTCANIVERFFAKCSLERTLMRTAISTSSSFLCQFPRRRRDYLVVTYTPGNTKTRFSWLPVKSPKATNLNVTKAGGVPWSMVGSDRWSRGKEEEPGRPCHVPWPRDATDDARGFLLLIPFFDIKPLDLVNLARRQSFSFVAVLVEVQSDVVEPPTCSV